MACGIQVESVGTAQSLRWLLSQKARLSISVSPQSSAGRVNVYKGRKVHPAQMGPLVLLIFKCSLSLKSKPLIFALIMKFGQTIFQLPLKEKGFLSSLT
jgi:hypothetical protein